MPLLAFIPCHIFCILFPSPNKFVCELCLHYHPHLVTTVTMCSTFHPFTLSLSPNMVSQSVRHAYHFKLQPYYSLLLYIVPEAEHVDLDSELCLHYHPYLATSIKLCTPFYSFTLTMSSRILSQSASIWNSLHITTVLQFSLVYCPQVPIYWPFLYYITIQS